MTRSGARSRQDEAGATLSCVSPTWPTIRAAAAAGTPTDILEGLLSAGAERALLGNFVDPATAARCHEAGVGARLRVVLNDGRADAHAQAVPVELEVLRAFRWRCRRSSRRRRGADDPSGHECAGASADSRWSCARAAYSARTPAYFESLGLDVGAFASLTVKITRALPRGLRRMVIRTHRSSKSTLPGSRHRCSSAMPGRPCRAPSGHSMAKPIGPRPACKICDHRKAFVIPDGALRA